MRKATKKRQQKQDLLDLLDLKKAVEQLQREAIEKTMLEKATSSAIEVLSTTFSSEATKTRHTLDLHRAVQTEFEQRLLQIVGNADRSRAAIDALREDLAEVVSNQKILLEKIVDGRSRSNKAMAELSQRISKLAEEHGTAVDSLEKRHGAVELQIHSATEALATDVQSLADGLQNLKSKCEAVKHETEQSVGSVARLVDDFRHTDQVAVEEKFRQFKDTVDELGSDYGMAVGALQRQQQKLQSSFEESVRSASSDWDAFSLKLKSLESSFASQFASLNRQVSHLKAEGQSRHSTTAKAIHSLADIVHASAADMQLS